MSRRSVAALATCATLLLSSGCAAFSDDAGGAASDGELRVVAAFYPLQFVTQRVAGDEAEVTTLTKPGGEPHDLELAPRQTADISEADVLVFESGFQPSVDQSVKANAGDARKVDAAEVVDLLPSEEHGEEGHGNEEHADEEHADEEHDHGDVDPHFWQDPARMAVLGDAVAETLGEADPDRAEEYAANAKALHSDLDELDASYAEALTGCERNTVVASHDAFGYLEKYDLHFESINGLSPGAEPTPADLARLQDLIKSDGITTVFSERLVSASLAESLAGDAGVETAVLDPIEGLSDETSGEDYLSLMRANLEALTKANGCT